MRGEIVKGLSVSMRESGLTREEISARVSDYLGEHVSEDMLNAYASEAKEEHVINLARWVAFIEATSGDLRLMNHIAQKFGHIVVPQKYEALIREKMLEDAIETMERDMIRKNRRLPR